MLKTVFIWNAVLCMCMDEWIYSTDNFSNQAVVDFKIQTSLYHTLKKALKNVRQKQTSMYRVIFVTLLTNKSQAHGVTITDLYAETSFYTTLNNRKWQHCFGITGNRSIHLHYTAAICFCQWSLCEVIETFSWSIKYCL